MVIIKKLIKLGKLQKSLNYIDLKYKKIIRS